MKNQLIWEDSVAGKDWRQEEKETREGEWLDGITKFSWVQFVKLLSHVHLFATPWIAVCQVSTAHHQLPESTQTHVHRVSDAIQPSHPLSCISPPSPYPSQYVCSIRVLEKARFRKTMRPAFYRNRSPLMRWERAAVRLVSCCTNPRSEWIYIYRHIFGKPLS